MDISIAMIQLKYKTSAAKSRRKRPVALLHQNEIPEETHVITRLAKHRTVILGALALAALVSGNVAVADPAPCDVRLSVELTPDVPDPRDEEFISSLLDDQVDYQLTLRREASDTAIVLELTGPGPAYRCQKVLDVIRKDARVLSVHVRQ
jgi:hypothetical protein